MVGAVIERGPARAELSDNPTFDEFARHWFRMRHPTLRRTGREHYEWTLGHLLPFFGHRHLSEITVPLTDRYRHWESTKGDLKPTSINRMLDSLKQILDLAHEYGLIDENPMRINPPNRKLKVRKPVPVWLDRAEHVRALLNAAGELDALSRRDRQHIARRAILATLVFAGLWIDELLHLQWRAVDLEGNVLVIPTPNMPYGLRRIELLPPLKAELAALMHLRPIHGLKATRQVGPDALVFPSSTGQPLSASNVRNRVLAPAVKRANARLTETGGVPLPDRLVPTDLRHTFASILIAIGEDVGSVQDQMGHINALSTLGTWRHAMRRDEASQRALRELVGLADSAAASRATMRA